MERMVLHFTPPSFSSMSLVERFFRDLTVECVRHGSFSSVAGLIKAMAAYLVDRDLNPGPYQWKAEGASIVEEIQRARGAIAKVKADNNE